MKLFFNWFLITYSFLQSLAVMKWFNVSKCS
jgi:hypothetical protein